MTQPTPGPLTQRTFKTASSYCESLLWIRDQRGTEIPLHWNPAQRHIQKMKAKAVKAGRKHRFLVPKARRLGVTTQEQALNFALVSNYSGQMAVTLADTSDKSRRIFQIASLFYDRL